MKTSNPYHDLIAKHLSGETSPDEERVLAQWLMADEANQKFFDELKQVWEWTEGTGAHEFSEGKEAAWKRIDSATQSSSASSVKVVRMFSRPLRVVAAVLLALVMVWWLVSDHTPKSQVLVFETGPGEKMDLTLPDSSLVTLNQLSRLEYRTPFDERLVRLSGEAFYEVAKRQGATFTVEAAGVTTAVLGTSFNVRAYPSENTVEVGVSQGLVSVSTAGGDAPDETLFLEAGEAARANRCDASLVKMAATNAAAWKTGVLHFDDTEMSEIVETLQRYFGRAITVSDTALLKCHYSATFDPPVLDEVIGVLSATLGFEVIPSGDTLILKGQHCQPGH